MTYFEGFVVPVPKANKDAYIKFDHEMAPLLQEIGVRRFVEAWADDVPDGKVTDFRTSVNAKDDEDVVFAFFEYPDKAARDSANEKMRSDERMKEIGANVPFDGKRMIFGGFEAIVEEGEGGGAYTDGFVVPVPQGKRETYRELAAKMAKVFRQHGATACDRSLWRRCAQGRGHRLLSRGEGRGRRRRRLLVHRMAGQGDPRRGVGKRSWRTRA